MNRIFKKKQITKENITYDEFKSLIVENSLPENIFTNENFKSVENLWLIFFRSKHKNFKDYLNSILVDLGKKDLLIGFSISDEKNLCTILILSKNVSINTFTFDTIDIPKFNANIKSQNLNEAWKTLIGESAKCIQENKNKFNTKYSYEILKKLINEEAINFYKNWRKDLDLKKQIELLNLNNGCKYFYKEILEDFIGSFVPVILHITLRGYPFGGGEAFIKDSTGWASSRGYRSVWISFRDINFNLYTELKVETLDNGCLIMQIPGGDTEQSIVEIINYVRSAFAIMIINTQGELNQLISDYSVKNKIPCIVGYHYWMGMVDLGKTLNHSIIDNIENHKIIESFASQKSKYIIKYVVSNFMKDVLSALGYYESIPIIEPIDLDDIKLPVKKNNGQRISKKIILQINCSIQKGGEIFYACAKSNSKNTFVGLIPTFQEARALAERLKVSPAQLANLGIKVGYFDAQGLLETAEALLFPTLVDETYGRVAIEAVVKGIPVLHTGNGNLKYLIGNIGRINSINPQIWKKKVNEILANKNSLKEIAQKQYQFIYEKQIGGKKKFIDLVKLGISRSTQNNIAFFVPWADQGLGIQIRNYVKIFNAYGFKTHIFSHRPYLAKEESYIYQSNPEEWKIEPNEGSVYYSLSYREDVQVSEIRDFCTINNVGHLVVPEVCWTVNWNRLKSLNVNNLFIHLVPNVETLRSKEINQHSEFHRVWCNTNVLYEKLQKNKVNNLHKILHSALIINNKDFFIAKKNKIRQSSRIKILHVSGYGSLTRKQTDKIIEAYAIASAVRKDIEFTLAIQNRIPADLLKKATSSRNLKLIHGNLSHDEIINLYKDANISIQVSSHEGLGLGFYESISMGVPVISLNCSPHNEIIKNNINGILLECSEFQLRDNDDAVVSGYSFQIFDLVKTITMLNKRSIIKWINGCEETISAGSPYEVKTHISNLLKAII
jgi:glycosyltransferase involved in cell wall biosynthesis